jgi:hypothetical protein
MLVSVDGHCARLRRIVRLVVVDLLRLAVGGIAVLIPRLAAAAPLVNPDFSQGLTGWVVVEEGGAVTPGSVSAVPGGARLVDGDSLLVRLEQTFTLEPTARELGFTVTPSPSFDQDTGFIPDAFEARLLDAGGRPVAPPWDVISTAFINLQEDGEVLSSAPVSWSQGRVTLDLMGLPRDEPLTLVFSMVGNDRGVDSAVVVGRVSVRHTNRGPMADAGVDQVVECGEDIVLDGGGSTDPDGDVLAYVWTGAGVVVGEQEVVTLGRGVGLWAYELTVSDAASVTAIDEVSVEVRDTTPPLVTVAPETTVTVDSVTCEGVVPDLCGVSDICGGAQVAQEPVVDELIALLSGASTANPKSDPG